MHILAILIGSCSNPLEKFCFEATKYFVKYLVNRLQNARNRELLVCLGSVKELLRRNETHEIFRGEDGVRTLVNLMGKETQNAQLLYLVGVCIWLLTYNPTMCQVLQEHGAIRKLVSTLKTAIFEKVVRVNLACLRNMLEHAPLMLDGNERSGDRFSEEMVGADLLKNLDGLMKRKWKDQDIVIDMKVIFDRLEDTVKKLSSFEIYQAEVYSGSLQWSPAHKNERFWRENIQFFEQKNFTLVQRLIQSLDDEDDSVREIACYDLGEFSRFHPDGKNIIARLGGKEKLLKNMKDKNPKVAKQALLSLQKLMVQNWEVLNKTSQAGVGYLVSQKK